MQAAAQARRTHREPWWPCLWARNSPSSEERWELRAVSGDGDAAECSSTGGAGAKALRWRLADVSLPREAGSHGCRAHTPSLKLVP